VVGDSAAAHLWHIPPVTSKRLSPLSAPKPGRLDNSTLGPAVSRVSPLDGGFFIEFSHLRPDQHFHGGLSRASRSTLSSGLVYSSEGSG
jgi:hypothetical protein